MNKRQRGSAVSEYVVQRSRQANQPEAPCREPMEQTWQTYEHGCYHLVTRQLENKAAALALYTSCETRTKIGFGSQLHLKINRKDCAGKAGTDV